MLRPISSSEPPEFPLGARRLKSPHLLLAGGNPRRLKNELAGLLNAAALDAIEAEIRRNVIQLLGLGLSHLAFATNAARKDWRQCVSRLYYACYACSRSVRLEVEGRFTTDSTDHKKVGELPADFPERERFKNQLLRVSARIGISRTTTTQPWRVTWFTQ